MLKHISVALLLLTAVTGCSANREPAQSAGTATPTQRVTTSTLHAAPPKATVTASPMPLDIPTATAAPAAGQPPADPERATYQITTYVVQPGDTLWSIAIAYGTSLDELMTANTLADPDVIWAGQELVIPNPAVSIAAIEPAPAIPTQPPPGSLEVEDLSTLRHLGRPVFDPVDLQPLKDYVLLEPMLHDWQKMNNCAPTTVAMALSYYNLLLTQFDTAPLLKGGPQDKNVSPSEIVTYLHDQGFGGVVRVNGNIETLQRLVSNNIPVIVEQWLDRPDDELTGHYRLVRGYDETTQEIIVNDSYNGPRLRLSHSEFDRLWRPFNRVYIPVYQPSHESVVRSIIGDNWSDHQMYQQATETARTEIDSLGDVYAWFNLGNSLLGLGEYEAAAAAFDRAIEIGLPSRMLWYQFGPFEALNQTGQFQRVLELSAPLTSLALEELHYQRGVAYEGLRHYTTALEEYRQAAELNPRLRKAADAVARLNSADGS
ncbi:MAG: LysM peptidoglycan-binding domain-containing protein [Anaerolineae bacterium]